MEMIKKAQNGFVRLSGGANYGTKEAYVHPSAVIAIERVEKIHHSFSRIHLKSGSVIEISHHISDLSKVLIGCEEEPVKIT